MPCTTQLLSYRPLLFWILPALPALRLAADRVSQMTTEREAKVRAGSIKVSVRISDEVTVEFLERTARIRGVSIHLAAGQILSAAANREDQRDVLVESVSDLTEQLQEVGDKVDALMELYGMAAK